MNRQVIIKIYGREENNNSIYFIEDNGVGIDINNQSKIFELFTRLDPSKGDGEGIGLSIVNKIVQNHKGTIRIESQINKGTIFIITLPK
jgi:signal transduction histidine kinase